MPRTPRGSDINPFVDLEGEYVEKRISPRPLRTSNTNPFITASADTEKRVSPRDLIRGRQRSGSTTDLRSPRVDLARRQLQASLQHRKSGSSFPAFSSFSEMQDDFSGPLLDDVATDEVSDDETGEPLEAPKVLIKRSGSGRVPSLRLNKPKEQVSPRMVRHKDAKEPLSESVTAKSLLFRNLSFGFPITDKKKLG